MSRDQRVHFLDGHEDLTRDQIGGKAFSLNLMSAMGLPIPPAFALPTSEGARYRDAGNVLDDALWRDILQAIGRLEKITGRQFGQGPSPLLVSVRSGAAESMPGMMDTVLNLGLTPELTDALALSSGDREWADDTWRRFCESYSTIVLDSPGMSPPADPFDQLRDAIGAVFRSWTNKRVEAYRARHNLTDLTGTAVTVQAMVFGNRDDRSGTGVLFSRDPASGAAEVTGEWLARAQGEEVVSGSRTPMNLGELGAVDPTLHNELVTIADLLEKSIRDMVDVEFTVESGRLYVLQSRSGKRTPIAAVRIAADMVREELITPEEAVNRISHEHAARLAETHDVDDTHELLAHGTGIGTGVASGLAVGDPDDAEARAARGESVVLVRAMTSPEDVPTMFSSVAVVTEVGGSTSHAALVCREIGLPCVVGCGAGTIDALIGQIVTVDGTSGDIWAGSSSEGVHEMNPHLAELLSHVRSPLPEDHPLAGFVSRELARKI